MLFRDNKQHNKPHVHVYYGEYEAAVGIDGELLAGSLPRKQLKIVVGWLIMKRPHIKFGIWRFRANILKKFRRCKEVWAMYEINGICYAGRLEEGIKIIDVKVLRGGMMLVTFSTGEKRLFDATVLQGSAFEPLKDEAVLKDFSIFHGVLTWKNGEIDIVPEAVYVDSFAYDEAV